MNELVDQQIRVALIGEDSGVATGIFKGWTFNEFLILEESKGVYYYPKTAILWITKEEESK